MPKKNTDEKIDELAIAVGRGFESILDKFDAFRKEMDDRFDRIEFLVAGQERRISILEDKMRLLSTKIGI